mmetsp:Transcript_20729/g.31815  ORF Transcript_20729/g.31815 Transcript_20729/m.31815 type:complete len:204 (-) Transcript_20729:8413-9024(-)
MEVALNVVDEVFIEFILSIDDLALAESSFLASVDQSHVVFTVEEAWDLSTREEGVHPLEESSRENVAFVEDEADLLVLGACSLHDSSQVFVEVVDRIISACLDLEHLKVVKPRDESCQGGLSDTGSSDQEKMAEGLSQNAVNSQDVVDNSVEDDQLDIQLFFVEGSQSSLDVSFQLVLRDGDVILLDEVRKVDRALQSFHRVH